MANYEEFLEDIYDSISKEFNNQTIYVKGKNEVNNIVVFDEPNLNREKSRYRIAYSGIIVLNDDKPLIAIEAIPNKPTPPKDIAGPIPIYMIARKIVITFKNRSTKEYELVDGDSKFNLLVVVPDQPESGLKSVQIKDLNEKFKGVFDLGSEYSNLKDFEICEFSDINSALKKLK
ncbi:hypothetical protein [Methanobacterium sp.]|uniref:hypothetical protein n=1 Tax=Methanobacterium sp. TaxID=2164 RepID=UPI003C779764